jgi:hypothetical protein
VLCLCLCCAVRVLCCAVVSLRAVCSADSVLRVL